MHGLERSASPLLIDVIVLTAMTVLREVASLGNKMICDEIELCLVLHGREIHLADFDMAKGRCIADMYQQRGT